MAKTIFICTKENTAQIIVDGNEISDVLSYELSENTQGARLKLELAVIGAIEAQIG